MTDTFEPGSTLKPFTVALALDTKRVTPTTMFDTGNGRMIVGDRTIRDTHRARHDRRVSTIIQKSSNIGMTKIALPMPPQEMWEMFTKSGFGQAPRFGFPGAVAGRVRPYKIVAPDRAGQHVVRPGHLGVAAAAGALVHDLRARRRHHSAVVPEGDRERRSASR